MSKNTIKLEELLSSFENMEDGGWMYYGDVDPKEALEELLTAKLEEYYSGVEEGVTRYAWWKNGEMFCGASSATPIKEALDEIRQELVRELENVKFTLGKKHEQIQK